MLKIKLLTYLFKCSFVVITCLMLNACSVNYLFNAQTEKYSKTIYVDSIPDNKGMALRSELRYYFNNIDKNLSTYILKVSLRSEESFQLNNLYGFASQSESWFIYNWKLVDSKTGKVYISSSDYRVSYYKINPSAYETHNNQELYENFTMKLIAKNIALKVISLLQSTKGNLSVISFR